MSETMSETIPTFGQRLAQIIVSRPKMAETAIARLIDAEIAAALASQVSGDGPLAPSTISHNFLGAFCAVQGCGIKRAGRSRYCKKHDMRFRRGNDPAIDVPRGRPEKGKL